MTHLNKLIYSGHGIQRMFEYDIKKIDVEFVIQNSKIIEEYPDDKPYPSYLLLGFVNNKPIHLVLAIKENEKKGVIVTVYRPDPLLWNNNFSKRRDKK